MIYILSTLPGVASMFVILKSSSLCVLTAPIDVGLMFYISTLSSLVLTLETEFNNILPTTYPAV